MIYRASRRPPKRRLWIHTAAEVCSIQIGVPMLTDVADETLEQEALTLAAMLADVLPIHTFNTLVQRLTEIANA